MILVLGALAMTEAQAATGWGDGCKTIGTVSYVFIADDTIFSIINGYACAVSSTGNQAVLAGAAAVLSEAMTSGIPAQLDFNATGVSALITSL